MSDPHPQGDPPPASEPAPGKPEEPPRARIKTARWRGWIWAVPLAAAILVGYLVIRTWLLSGPKVTVTFPSAQGINPEGIPVRYRGVKLGSVKDVELTNDGKSVKLTLSMNSSAKKILRSGTTFWIVQPDIFGGNVSEALSGAYIEMRPGPGSEMRSFVGSPRPPPLIPPGPGHTCVVFTPDAQGIKQGSSVLYRGHDAGEVLDVVYDPARDGLRIEAFVREPFDKRVGVKSRFWRAGGLRFSASGGGFGFDMPPLDTLLKGGIAFGNVADQGQPEATPDTRPAQTQFAGSGATSDLTFKLYESKDEAREGLSGPAVTFAARFDGAVGDLKPGQPVDLQGYKVGELRHVDLRYDPPSERMVTSVTIALYPERFGITDQAKPGERPFEQVVANLVKHGLRAQVGSSIPLIGSKQVSLTIAEHAPPATLDLASRPPQIPTIKSGDVDGLMASLQNAADAATAAAKSIGQLAGGSPGQENDVQKLIDELIQTARSVRTLADYLQRHPEALIQGRKNQ